MKPRLLDLFCGAGGAARGYADAGFEVVGVDIKPQPHYPYEFVQGDALELLPEMVDRYQPAAVHASPPCQAYSLLQKLPGIGVHPELVPATREALCATGRPWVMENVPGAPMPGSLVLCGTEFGLSAICRDGRRRWLRRHRQFEASIWLVGAGGCNCRGRLIGGAYGSGGGPLGNGWKFHAADRRIALGVPWMTREEASQAIPPAYTQFIGEQLLTHLTTTIHHTGGTT